MRPWNAKNTRSRDGGVYYGKAWSAAIDATKHVISTKGRSAFLNSVAITSFNEWHEGTQIEPCEARPGFLCDGEDYLRATRSWAERFEDVLHPDGDLHFVHSDEV